MIFKRKFSSREKILLCVLAVILLVSCYYFLVHAPVSAAVEKAKAEKVSLEDELLALEILQVRYDKMAQELEVLGSAPAVETPEYDNLLQLMAFLNNALASAKDYELSFDSVETSDDGIVRRNVNMSFTASGYYSARNIVKTLQNCPYRCIISDMQFIPAKDKNTDFATVTDGQLEVTLTVTFFEKSKN